MVTRDLAKVETAGSSPVYRSKKNSVSIRLTGFSFDLKFKKIVTFSHLLPISLHFCGISSLFRMSSRHNHTWFNRIIAIRFMEVNNYLPTKVRVLSSETGSTTPDIVTQADSVDLNLSSVEMGKIVSAKKDNNYDEAFRILFVKQCNELNKILPGLFEKIDDYMELLLKIPYTSDGVVRLLVDTIPESNFNVAEEGQVEIIGWLYQYYNTELKDDTFGNMINKQKLGFSYEDANSINIAKKVNVPSLIINSKADEMTPFFMGEEIYNNINCDNKEIWTVDDSEHACIWEDHTDEYKLEMDEFISSSGK